MTTLDWVVMLLAMILILVIGIWKGRGQTGTQTYLLAGRQMPWHVVLLSIMATQASAITFLSGPGQAYSDGMRFVQYYFGLPLAMIVISMVFVPIFQKLNVVTAYEYLDQRFNKSTRLFTGILFLFSRGVSTGISVYAPAIILSTIFGWNIYITNILTGGLLIIYTFSGGAQAIAHTQKIQFSIILVAMAIAGFMVVYLLPEPYSLSDALYFAGKSGKLNVITANFDIKDKYNIISGVIGGFFLALSYFGTDQSQVGRYLSAKDTRESRLGLLLNGFVKIPMQFCILLIGALLFSFYALQQAPLFFNEAATQKMSIHYPKEYDSINNTFNEIQQQHKANAISLLNLRHQTQEKINNDAEEQRLIKELQVQQEALKDQKKAFSTKVKEHKNTIAESENDTNYVFLHFVRHYLPPGLVGLLFAIVILASWGSISAAINSLASSTLIDFHMVFSKQTLSDKQQLWYGRLYTLIWGIFSIAVAMFATKLNSLIEAVNELGSLFYGAILGIFLTAFFMKKVQGKAVLIAALFTEITVIVIYCLDIVGFLWLNVIGTLLLMLLAGLFQQILPQKKSKSIDYR
jgi:SSS family solute:Na+ symporter